MNQEQQERVYQLLLKRLQATSSGDFEEFKDEKGAPIGYVASIATTEGIYSAKIFRSGLSSSQATPRRELRVTAYEVETVGVKKEKLVLRREEDVASTSVLNKLYMRVDKDYHEAAQQRDDERLNALEAALVEEE